MDLEAHDISVIIPAFNAEKHILRALKSIELQTRLPDEVIIVRENTPIPVDEILNNNDEIRIINVASGG